MGLHRTTVMLPPELKARALRRAREEGLSLGELIRRSLAAILTEVAVSRAEDPLFADGAVFGGDVHADLASEHDRYLYDDAG